MFTVNKNPSTKELEKFGAAMLIGFWIVGMILNFAPFLRSWDILDLGWKDTVQEYVAVGFCALGAGLCLISFTWPAGAKPVYVVWMTIGIAIGTVMTTILLTLMFLLFLPIFSLVVRLGDPLRKKWITGGTYWEDYKKHEPTMERLQRAF